MKAREVESQTTESPSLPPPSSKSKGASQIRLRVKWNPIFHQLSVQSTNVINDHNDRRKGGDVIDLHLSDGYCWLRGSYDTDYLEMAVMQRTKFCNINVGNEVGGLPWYVSWYVIPWL